MKHMVTNLEAPNEPVMFTNSILGNYFIDVNFGEVSFEKSPFLEINNQSELPHRTLIGEFNQAESSVTQTDVDLENANLDRIRSSAEIGT